MESLSFSLANPANSPENNVGNKADCYFYYYSSCNKGSACPYRHEPSALRNETMCVYWLKGSCNKPHCIYRHMEIKKNRNKIPCFFESQPGGCKKLHCPFFHDNVLDQPREEDVPNNPDLILPVKDSELQYETEESEFKKLQESVASQLKIHRRISDSLGSLSKDNKDKEAVSDVHLPSLVRRSIIVPLQDGESDSESVTVTPIKSSESNRRCIFTNSESDWELERLKEIQREESNLLGYSFCDDDDDDENLSLHNAESQFIEETEDCEFENDSPSYTFVRKNFECSHPSQQHPHARENFGSLAKRVIGETLIGNNRADGIHFKNLSLSLLGSEEDNQLGRRIKLKESPKKKISVKERLSNKPQDIREKNNSINKREDPANLRLGLQEGNFKRRINSNDDDRPKYNSSKFNSSNLIIKSLAEIKAQRNKGKTSGGGKVRRNLSPELLPLSAYINNDEKASKNSVNTVAVEDIKIKTLAEIRAEKKNKVTHAESPQKISLNNPSDKRSYSPINFEIDIHKKLKSNGNTKTENQKPILRSFQPRKLSLKRSPQAKFSPIESKKTKPHNSLHLQKERITSTSNEKLNHEIKNEQHYTQSNGKEVTSSGNAIKMDTFKRRESADNSSKNHRLKIGRLDSYIDEEELLLLDDSANVDVEDIDEEELLS